DAASVRARLAEARGSPLEPFHLTPEAQEMAVRLVRVCFSRKSPVSRVRIVSCETLGGKGGLVLTRSLKGCFIERFGHRLRHRGASGSYLDSAAIPSGEAKDTGSALRLTYCVTKRGAWFELPSEVFGGGEPTVTELARDLQEHSRLAGRRLES